MKHRIRAAGIAVNDDRILLIKHVHEDDEYWVPPGGGLEPGDGSTEGTVKREVFEESGLEVTVGPLIFVREFFEKSRNTYHVEQFYMITEWRGELSLDNLRGLGGDEHVITKARWLSREELVTVKVFPEELRDLLWSKIKEPSISACHLGVQIEGS